MPLFVSAGIQKKHRRNKLKFALLKLCFLATAATLATPAAHAQIKMKYPAATFDADESKSATNSNTKLHSASALNDTKTPVVEQPAPGPAVVEAETHVATAAPVVAEPMVAEPMVAEPVVTASVPVTSTSQPEQAPQTSTNTDSAPMAVATPTEVPVVAPMAAAAPEPQYTPPAPAPTAEPITIAASSYAAPLPEATHDNTPASTPPVAPSPPPRRATVDADGWPIDDGSTYNTPTARSAAGTEDWPSEQYTPPTGLKGTPSKSKRNTQKAASHAETSSTRAKATARAPSSSPSTPTPAAAPAASASVSSEATSSAGLSSTSATAEDNAKMTFRIQAGERMSDVFARWANATGWQMTWEPEDIIAMADLSLDDTLSGAISKVIDALNRGGANIQARFYDANHMLRIMARK